MPTPADQQIINYGATANDGTGDPLRTAFIKTENNFDSIWAAGPVGSNVTILNNTLSAINTNGNLILRPNGIGIVQSNAHVIPDTTRVRNLGSNSRYWDTLYVWSANVGGNLTVAGPINGEVVQTVDGLGTLYLKSDGAASSTVQVSTYHTTWTFDQYDLTQSAGNLSIFGNVSAANVNVKTDGMFYSPAGAIGVPTYDTRSVGTKMVLYPQVGVNNVDYALGINASTMWLSVPTTSCQFEFYQGNVAKASISGNGNFSAVGSVTGKMTVTAPVTLASLTATAGARAFANDANLVAAGNFGAQVSGGAGNTVPIWSDGSNWYIG